MPKSKGKLWYKNLTRQRKKAVSMKVSWRRGTGTPMSTEQALAIIANPPTCPYCNTPIHWQELSLDHKIPRSRSGADHPSNVVWTDWGCNSMKGNLTDTEFVILLEFLNKHGKMGKLIKTRLKQSGYMYGR